MADKKRYDYSRRPEADPVTVSQQRSRPCLSCKKKFPSNHAGNRLCKVCLPRVTRQDAVAMI